MVERAAAQYTPQLPCCRLTRGCILQYQLAFLRRANMTPKSELAPSLLLADLRLWLPRCGRAGTAADVQSVLHLAGFCKMAELVLPAPSLCF